ncbi:copper-binding protein [Aeromonas cavernicola]|uniref:Secretion protein HlyD n=1 Tax=Aeromonas cavernicola TaxID=1006623 RepID=A0A2H9U1M1_9GAMM|nr:copper-binding protein [Aeromonas cavernicola]PJG57858.1 secretion protein HlyD [Aeromonas cavernicola]
MNYKTLAITLLLSLATYSQAQAANHQGHDMSQMGEMKGMQEMTMTRGVISRIDEANGKIGIKHETISNLNMPPMTMVFSVADPAQLKGLKAGDPVSFHAENQGGQLTVTHIQPQ